jgi:serine/threonine-protein kinase RsbW
MPTSPQPSPSSLPSDEATVSLRHQRPEIEALEKQILDAATRHAYPAASQFAIRLAFEEALANAFRHGHKNLSPDVPITVHFHVTAPEVRIEIEDRGPGFKPDTVPDPTLDENLENPTGRGLMLIRAYMTTVEFNPAGNRVIMTYKKP